MDAMEKLEVISHLGDHITYKEDVGICYDSALAKAIEDAYMELKNGVTVQQWTSVKDRLPIEEAIAFEEEWDDYPEFLVMIDGGYLPTTLYYDLEENEWFRINTALNRETYRVTHWQCLPRPPKGE